MALYWLTSEQLIQSLEGFLTCGGPIPFPYFPQEVSQRFPHLAEPFYEPPIEVGEAQNGLHILHITGTGHFWTACPFSLHMEMPYSEIWYPRYSTSFRLKRDLSIDACSLASLIRCNSF